MPPRKKTGSAKGPASIAEGLNLDNKVEAMGQIMDRLENLTDKSGRTISDLFLELPDREEYPDYYVMIKNPIALDTISARLDSGAYNDGKIVDFGNDLRVLTANAKEYNRPGSEVYKDATTLETYIDAAMKALTGEKPKKAEPEQFTPEFCNRVWKVIKTLKDEDGRQVSELFHELPSKEEYPDYYDEITKPIALDGIKKKINSGAYKSLKSFEDDFNLMFDNAKQYNAEGSDVYLDAEDLQRLFWKEIGKDGRGHGSKGKQTRKHAKELTEVVHHGETYRIADFVHLKNDSNPSKPNIALIMKLWEDDNGQRGLDAAWFLRPDQIVHPYASRFYSAEVVKASGSHEHLIDEIVEKCFVLYTKDYIKGRPEEWRQGLGIYVCEQRYNESYKSVSKIKNWPSCYPSGHHPNDVKLKLFPEPLVMKKLPSASMAEKAAKSESVDSESQSSTPQDTPIMAHKDVASGSKKRNSAQMLHASPPASASKPKPKPKPKQAPAATAPTPTPGSAFAQPHTEQPYHKTPHPTQQTHQVPPQQWVRCNYSSLSSGLQCSAVFNTSAELQHHITTDHAIVQNVAAPPALKRGRPKKSTHSSDPAASPQLSTVSPSQTASTPQQLMSQGAYSQQAYNPYGASQGVYAGASRQGMPGQGMSTTSPYTTQQQSMQSMQQQQRGVPYQSAYGQTSASGQSRHPGYTQTSAPYGSSYGQAYGHQQHSAYSQQAYGYSQFPQSYNSSQGYSHPSSQYPGSYSHQQQYSMPPQPSAYSQPYTTQPYTNQPYASQAYASQAYGSQSYPSQSSHPSQSHLQLGQQQMVQQQQYAQQQLAQQQQLTQQQQAFQQKTMGSASMPTLASQRINPSGDPYNTSSHGRSMSSGSAVSSHAAGSAMAMEGAGLGLSGVSSADHGRVLPSTTAGVSSAAMSSPLPLATTTTASTDSVGQHMWMPSGAMDNSSAAMALPKPHHSADYMVKRARMDSGEGPKMPGIGEDSLATAAAASHHAQHQHVPQPVQEPASSSSSSYQNGGGNGSEFLASSSSSSLSGGSGVNEEVSSVGGNHGHGYGNRAHPSEGELDGGVGHGMGLHSSNGVAPMTGSAGGSGGAEQAVVLPGIEALEGPPPPPQV